MPTILGVDVSENQPAGLPWPEWYAGGARVAVIRSSIGFVEDGGYERFVTHAAEAGFIVGAYHAILGHQYYDPLRQAADFLALVMPPVRFLVLDDEAPGVSAGDVAAFVGHVTAHSPLGLALYGNWNLAGHIAARPELAKFPVWWAGYPTFPNPTTDPPWNWPRNVPVELTAHVAGWQYAGDNGNLPPYPGAIDLSVWDEKSLLALLGSENNMDTALVQQLLAELGQAQEALNVAGTAVAAARAGLNRMTALLPVVPPPPPPQFHTMRDKTNQTVINLFSKVLSLPRLEAVLTSAQKVTLYLKDAAGVRSALYTGPAVEEMALTAAEKALVIAAL